MSRKEKVARLKAAGVIREIDMRPKLLELERTSTFLRFPPPPEVLKRDPSTDSVVMDLRKLAKRA